MLRSRYEARRQRPGARVIGTGPECRRPAARGAYPAAGQTVFATLPRTPPATRSAMASAAARAGTRSRLGTTAPVTFFVAPMVRGSGRQVRYDCLPLSFA